MDYYRRALELREETAAHRRHLHANAETGLELPGTRSYIMSRLSEYGYEPVRCGHGVTATAGKPGPAILLRADMDALPMREESGEPFASPDPNAAHTCGHDLHAAMLLTAARMLKESEQQLAGCVKLMFQPGEETFEGARDMIGSGVLEHPAPRAALALHVTSGRLPAGAYLYNPDGVMMYSADSFRIRIRGRGAHAAYPDASTDPINIAVHLHMALQSLIARESSPQERCMLSICSFNAGSAANVIPETAELQGSIRTASRDARERLTGRVRELAQKTAGVFGGSADTRLLNGTPPLSCDHDLTLAMAGYIESLGIPGAHPFPGITATASEDFALIAERIPSAYIFISAGFPDERGDHRAHEPQVRFNEDALPAGAACYAHCAARWLSENA